MDQLLETCPCPLCGSDVARPTPYAHPPFRLVRCASCTVWYLSPRLREHAISKTYSAQSYFGSGDDAMGYAAYEDQEHSLRRTFSRLLRQLDRMGLTGGALLEVGCGYGYFLDEAKHFFSRRVGTELAPSAVTIATTRADEIVEGGVDRVPEAPVFDCVVALQVIEHIYKPVEFLRSLSCRLKPGGVMVLAAPNMGALWRRVMGNKWPSFKWPEHVAFYDRRTLPALMLAAGLEDPKRLSYVHDFPLADVLRKLTLPAPKFTGSIPVPLPATTVCFTSRRAKDASS